MATLTFDTTAQAPIGLTYAQNVGRAARALLAALLTPPADSAARPAPAVRAKASTSDDMALYRLYCLASPYDSVMPNLAQELKVMASRDYE